MNWPPLDRPSLGRSVFLGGMAGSAYLATQALDMRVTRNRYDDLVLWGGFVTQHPVRSRVLGGLVHYSFSVGLAAAYQAMRPILPAGPSWLRAVLFVQAENAVLYPGVPLLNALHPGVRSGTLPPLTTWTFFWLEALRHAAFGLALGALSHENE